MRLSQPDWVFSALPVFVSALSAPIPWLMPLCLLLDTPGLSISYDPANQWHYVNWKGEHDADSSWAACARMLEVMRAVPCAKILNDNSNITRTSMQLSARSLEWLAHMHAAGLQCLAWVMPWELVSRRTTEGVVLAIEVPIVCTFDDLASAYAWLQRQPSSGPAARAPNGSAPAHLVDLGDVVA
jgi:hypothetical protein